MPGSILPDQFYDVVSDVARDTPERRLLFAVLLDAVVQLRRRHTDGAREAVRWIQDSDGHTDAPFSFHSVCEALGLNAQYLARGLLAARSLQTLIGVPRRQLRISHQHVTLPRQRRRHRRAAVA